MSTSNLRAIPSVDRVLRELNQAEVPRALIARVARRELDGIRAEALQSDGDLSSEHIIQRVRRKIDSLRVQRMRPLINATGIIIHTNFGRAPLAPSAILAITD